MKLTSIKATNAERYLNYTVKQVKSNRTVLGCTHEAKLQKTKKMQKEILITLLKTSKE